MATYSQGGYSRETSEGAEITFSHESAEDIKNAITTTPRTGNGTRNTTIIETAYGETLTVLLPSPPSGEPRRKRPSPINTKLWWSILGGTCLILTILVTVLIKPGTRRSRSTTYQYGSGNYGGSGSYIPPVNSYGHGFYNIQPKEEGKCKRATCQVTVREMLSSLNTSVDPCDNFYEFACQGWQHQNPRPNYISRWNVFQKLKQQTNEDIITNILQVPIHYQSLQFNTKFTNKPTDPQALRQAKGFFKKCRENDNNLDLALMWKLLDDYGGWPLLYPEGTWNSSRFDWMKSVVDLKRRFDRVIILDVVSYQNPLGEMAENRVVLKPATTIRSGKEGIVPEGTKPNDKSLATIDTIKQFIVNVSRELLLVKGETNINETYLEEKAFEILLVQVGLLDLAEKNVSTLFKAVHGFLETRGETTLYKLQDMIDDYLIFYKADLKKFLSMVYSNANVYIENTEPIFVSNIDYLLEVSLYVSTLKPEALANFLQFQMAIELASMTNRKMQGYVQTLKAALHGTTEEMPRSTYCSEIVQEKFHHALGHAYVKHKYPNWLKAVDVIDKASSLFKNAKQQLKQLVSSSKFNYNYYNASILETKIALTGLCVGFPSWIYDANSVQAEYVGLQVTQNTFLEQYLEINAWSVDKELQTLREARDIINNYCDWSQFVGMVGAYLDVKSFTVYVPLGILQAPYISTDFPDALNYGRLGTILGHELGHALGSNGWTSFQNGSLNPNADCFARQYDNYTTTGLYAQNITLDGFLTMNENIPDNVGLLQAFKAYKLLKRGEENKPRGLEAYSNDQLFFLSFAQNWCESNTLENFRRALQKDKHSPGIFRVLGTLRNSKEFARSWNCPAGSKMNPQVAEKEKCSMF